MKGKSSIRAVRKYFAFILSIFCVVGVMYPLLAEESIPFPSAEDSNTWRIEEWNSKKGQKNYIASVNYITGEMKLRTKVDNETFDRVKIEREINKNNNSIKWTVKFNPSNNEYGIRMQHILFLPHFQAISDIAQVNYKKNTDESVTPKYSPISFNNWASDDIVHQKKRVDVINTGYASDFFAKNTPYSAYNQVEAIKNAAVKGFWKDGSNGNAKIKGWYRDLNKWFESPQKNIFSVILREDTKGDYQKSTWTFTTYHAPGTDLEKVPMMAKISQGLHDGSRMFVHAIAPVGARLWINMKYTPDFWVKDKANLDNNEKTNLLKEVKNETLSDSGIDPTIEKEVKGNNSNWQLTEAGTGINKRYIVKVQYFDGSKDELDVTKNVKEKRKYIPGSESNPPELKNYWVGQEYVKLFLDANEGSLKRKDGKRAEKFYYILKNAKLSSDFLNEVGDKENQKFLYWSYEKKGENVKNIFGKENKDTMSINAEKTIYGIYRPNLQIVLHNNKGDDKDITKVIYVTPDMFKEGVKIPSAFYSVEDEREQSNSLGNDFKKDEHTFVGWTLEKDFGNKVQFGPHIPYDANFTTSGDKYGKYSLKELKQGLDLTKNTANGAGKYTYPVYLPNAFKLTFDGQKLDDVIKEYVKSDGKIHLYANYRPYITVTAYKYFKKYTPATLDNQGHVTKAGEYTDDNNIKKAAVDMGLIFRTAVTDWSDPTVHYGANYHTLNPVNYNNQSVLRKYDPNNENNRPTWKVPGFDKHGLRLSYAVVEVTDSKKYENFKNDWAMLGVEVFTRIPDGTGKSLMDPRAPRAPKQHNGTNLIDYNIAGTGYKQAEVVPKVQSVSIKNADGKIDAYTAATTRYMVTKDNKKFEPTGYNMTIYNVPVTVSKPEVDEITHKDKFFTMKYYDNTAKGASVVDKIELKYNGEIYTLTRDFETKNTVESNEKIYKDTWKVDNKNNKAKFKAEFIEDKSKIKISFDGDGFFKYYVDPYNPDNDAQLKKDELYVTNLKGDKKSDATKVDFRAIIDSNKLINFEQDKNEYKGTDKKDWYTIIKTQIPNPVLNEAKQGTIYLLMPEDEIKSKGLNDKSKLQEYVNGLENNSSDHKLKDDDSHKEDSQKKYVNFKGDTYVLKEQKLSGHAITFRIPKGESEKYHNKKFRIISIEKKKIPVISDSFITLDTKAEFEESTNATSGSYGMRVNVKGAVMKNDYHDSLTLKIKSENSEETIPLYRNSFDFKDVINNSDKITLSFFDKFGNYAEKELTPTAMEQTEVNVIRPMINSRVLYINGIKDNAQVTVTLIKSSGRQIVVNNHTNGKFVFNTKFEKNDKIKVEVTNDNKKSNPYMVVVR